MVSTGWFPIEFSQGIRVVRRCDVDFEVIVHQLRLAPVAPSVDPHTRRKEHGQSQRGWTPPGHHGFAARG